MEQSFTADSKQCIQIMKKTPEISQVAPYCTVSEIRNCSEIPRDNIMGFSVSGCI